MSNTPPTPRAARGGAFRTGIHTLTKLGGNASFEMQTTLHTLNLVPILLFEFQTFTELRIFRNLSIVRRLGQVNAAGGLNPNTSGSALLRAATNAMVLWSWNSAPTACRPTGRPASDRPAGNTVDGL